MRYLTDGALTLICWCAPQPCHAEVIRDAVLGMVQARERAREARAHRTDVHLSVCNYLILLTRISDYKTFYSA